jgi:hypothetical protein
MLASLLYPYDSDAPKLIDKWLIELEEEKCILRYQFDGKTYLQIEKWTEHQKIDKPSKAKLPSPEDSRGLAKCSEGSRVIPEASDDPLEGSGTDQDQGRDQGEDLEKEKKALVERAFVSYCTVFKKNPKMYTLTDQRKEKAILRMEERLAVHDGDMNAVADEFKLAISNLNSSEFHRTKGYIDWTEQIFRSTEEFEKRINWQKPEVSGGSNGTYQGNQSRGNIRVEQQLEELRKAGVTIPSGRPEAGPEQNVPVAGRGDGFGSSGVVLEGVR